MKKLLFITILFIPCFSFSKDIHPATISCGNYEFDPKATTLGDVKDKCTALEILPSNGLIYVQFINSSTDKKVKCYFADNLPTAKISYCE